MRSSIALGVGLLLLASASCAPQTAPTTADQQGLAREAVNTLITGINRPSTALQGQPVSIQVSTAAPRPGETMTVSIAGVEAASRELVFDQYGPQSVLVEAIKRDARGGSSSTRGAWRSRSFPS